MERNVFCLLLYEKGFFKNNILALSFLQVSDVILPAWFTAQVAALHISRRKSKMKNERQELAHESIWHVGKCSTNHRPCQRHTEKKTWQLRYSCTCSDRGTQMEIQASILANRDILGRLGTDTQKLLIKSQTSPRHHLLFPPCGRVVSAA